MTKYNNLKNLRFVNLIVKEREENSKHGKSRWLCECDCGTEKIINAQELIRGQTRSCGCFADMSTSMRNYLRFDSLNL